MTHQRSIHAIRDTAERSGYCLVPGVFDPAWLAEIEPSLTLSDVGLFSAHPKVLGIALELCGPSLGTTDEVTANIRLPRAEYIGWHRDYSPIEVPCGMLPLWRFGVYFRDYSTHSDGLKVIPGSHLGYPYKAAHYETAHVVKSKPGDLVVWNHRLLHAAGADNDGLPIATPRTAVFFDYGTRGPWVDAYNAWRVIKKAEKPHKHGMA